MPSRGGLRNKASKGGRGGPPSREEKISKAMSYVLRHAAEREKIKMDEKGYVNVGDLLSWHRLSSLNVTFPELQQIVAADTKQRFALIPSSSSPTDAEQQSLSTPPSAANNPAHYLIRASQGHSLRLASANLLTPLDPLSAACPRSVVHGTRLETWPTILKSGGLKRMSRAHVHFATGLPRRDGGGGGGEGGGAPEAEAKAKATAKANGEEELVAVETLDSAAPGGQGGQEKIVTAAAAAEKAVISGMRSTADVLVWVDLRRSAQEGGLRWWKSENGVVLTEGDDKGMVGLEWIVKVEKRGTGEVVWRPSGEKDRKKGP
ncbi:MAG: hypothetical protein LQ342_001205 [Letrouitia transgressa]|nr:MAG: hypothetical protein LQ342_001205 [Letrouitia transgressa]